MTRVERLRRAGMAQAGLNDLDGLPVADEQAGVVEAQVVAGLAPDLRPPDGCSPNRLRAIGEPSFIVNDNASRSPTPSPTAAMCSASAEARAGHWRPSLVARKGTRPAIAASWRSMVTMRRGTSTWSTVRPSTSP